MAVMMRSTGGCCVVGGRIRRSWTSEKAYDHWARRWNGRCSMPSRSPDCREVLPACYQLVTWPCLRVKAFLTLCQALFLSPLYDFLFISNQELVGSTTSLIHNNYITYPLRKEDRREDSTRLHGPRVIRLMSRIKRVHLSIPLDRLKRSKCLIFDAKCCRDTWFEICPQSRCSRNRAPRDELLNRSLGVSLTYGPSAAGSLLL